MQRKSAADSLYIGKKPYLCNRKRGTAVSSYTSLVPWMRWLSQRSAKPRTAVRIRQVPPDLQKSLPSKSPGLLSYIGYLQLNNLSFMPAIVRKHPKRRPIIQRKLPNYRPWWKLRYISARTILTRLMALRGFPFTPALDSNDRFGLNGREGHNCIWRTRQHTVDFPTAS